MREVKIEWLQEFMKNKGLEISVEEATQILELLRKLAKIAVKQYLRN